ncbi:unknown [Firmicutes bacterium CAG:449]|nr:unknown [Firmicutes bacterium CAG:449]
MKKGGICNLKVVYIGLFFTLLVLLALTIRYLISFLIGNNDESLNYQIKCLELDKEIKRLEDLLNQKEIDTENKVVLEKVPEDIIFTEELEKLDDEHKKYYDAIVSYALSLKDVNVNVRKSYETLTYGKGKIIGKIVVLNGTLIVKFNFGKIKVSKEVEPLLLKTIKIEVKSEKEVEQVKKQIDIGYIKQSGQLKIEMRNEELV